jgi:hypothetical protein
MDPDTRSPAHNDLEFHVGSTLEHNVSICKYM